MHLSGNTNSLYCVFVYTWLWNNFLYGLKNCISPVLGLLLCPAIFRLIQWIFLKQKRSRFPFHQTGPSLLRKFPHLFPRDNSWYSPFSSYDSHSCQTYSKMIITYPKPSFQSSSYLYNSTFLSFYIILIIWYTLLQDLRVLTGFLSLMYTWNFYWKGSYRMDFKYEMGRSKRRPAL